MLNIKEKINQYLQVSEEELDKILLVLKEKGFLNPDDNSLEIFIEWLSIAHGWGEISGIKKASQELKYGKDSIDKYFQDLTKDSEQ